MKTIKVLITDDSVVYRSQIRAALQNIPEVEVVGAASNGRLALDRLSQTEVDLLILDLEMPEFDGIQTLTEIAKRHLKCKILVFSSVSKRGAEITLEALRLGASDFITKPDASSIASGDPSQRIKELLLPKIQGLFTEVAKPAPVMQKKPEATVVQNYPQVIWDLLNPSIIVIGSSTGGPTILEKIFSEVKAPVNCPIVIVQHMPPIFTASLAERLERASGIRAGEAKDGEVLEANRIYVAPGNFHMRLNGSSTQTLISLDQGEAINYVRPAVDPLFSTAAAIFKNRCLGFVLSGMGSDGAHGAVDIKKNGGAMIIQDQASCTVFGMPGAVQALGAFDKILTPAQIIEMINSKAKSGNQFKNLNSKVG